MTPSNKSKIFISVKCINFQFFGKIVMRLIFQKSKADKTSADLMVNDNAITH
jgi:hypothetical protein